MGREKVVNYFNGRYCGKMSKDQCEVLESLIEADEQQCSVVDLLHIIYNLSDADVINMIEDYEYFNQPMHEYTMSYGELLDYQTIAVCFMYYAVRCIIGDSVGMGKTVETAGVLNLIKRERAKSGKNHRYLVLTEKTAAPQFRSELVKFTGEFVQLLASGEKADIDKFTRDNPYDCDLEYSVVGTHALLSASGFLQWLEQCRTMGKGFPFFTLVIDESSILGGKARQTIESFKIISKYFNNIYFLNATPFETRLEIFYNQINLLDPDFLPTKKNFTDEYCIMDYRGMYPKPTGKYKNQENFKRLVKYRYFARTRRDKGAVMEDCDGRIILSSLSKVQKEWLQKSQLHRVVFDCPNHIDPSIDFNSENVPKLGSIKSLLENECAEADSIIVFVHFKEAQKSLADWLTMQGHSCRVLNGDTPNQTRKDIVRQFQNKEFRILLTNVQKALNFGNCNYCIFYSYDPNPAHMVQFEGRITRDFDIIGKHIYILCSMGEEYRTLASVVHERAKATTEFTNTDISVVLDILLGGANNGSD